MEKSFFDDEIIKNNRKLVLCPSCKNEFSINLEDTEAFCDECGESFTLLNESPEEFIWHPSQEY